jgi:hypothetical protein
MSHLVIFPPSQTESLTPFTDLARHGLFAAPWMARPSERELPAVDDLSREWIRTSSGSDRLTPVLGHLLAVRGHCLRAAAAGDVVTIRQHYAAAEAECRTVLGRLHGAEMGQTASLATWAQGVLKLIKAQQLMPDDPEEARKQVRQAMHLLMTIDDPICSGAKEDASAALTLSVEPAEIARRLDSLPEQILLAAEHIKAKVSMKESQLNERLQGVLFQHDRALKAILAWSAGNGLLMATLPLNGLIRPDLAWSAPFVVAVPLLWWWTFDHAFHDGLPFFGWVRMIRAESLADFHEATVDLPEPRGEFHDTVMVLLARGRTDRERLQAFCLFAMPAVHDTLGEAETYVRTARVDMEGDWMAELKDRHPLKLVDILPVEPSMIPTATRIWHGTSEH